MDNGMMRFKQYINEKYSYFRREKARREGSKVNKVVSDYFEKATVINTHHAIPNASQHPEYLDHINKLKNDLEITRANNPHLKDRFDNQDRLAKRSSEILKSRLEHDGVLHNVSEVRHVKDARHLFSMVGRIPEPGFSPRRYPHDLLLKMRDSTHHGASLKGTEKDTGTYNNLGAIRHSKEDTTGIAQGIHDHYANARIKSIGNNPSSDDKEKGRPDYVQTRFNIAEHITNNFNGSNSIDKQRTYLHSLLKPESDIPYYTVLPHRNEAIPHGRGRLKELIGKATKLSATRQGSIIQYHAHATTGNKIPLFYVEHRSTKGPWGPLQLNVKLGEYKKEA
jgi:hypothetical protein